MLIIASEPSLIIHLTHTHKSLSKIDLSINPEGEFQLTWDASMPSDLLDKAIQFLKDYAAKKPSKLPPISLEGTKFQLDVLNQLKQIPFAEQKSYQEIALILNRRGASRAVGNACGCNPLPLLIPCHRILASGGKLGGFSAGLKVKKELLRFEEISCL